MCKEQAKWRDSQVIILIESQIKLKKNKEINEEFKKHKTIKCISSPPKGFEKKMKCNLSKKKQVPTPLVLNAYNKPKTKLQPSSRRKEAENY